MSTFSFIAQIGKPNGIKGAGFLTTCGFVLTCAHVVNLALKRNGFATAKPTRLDKVELRFPYTADYHTTYEGEVVDWLPPGRTSDGRSDIALLSLTPSPSTVRPALLQKLDPDARERVRTTGFPAGWPHGCHAQGRLTGPDGAGWLQLLSSEGDQPFMPGHSGAPVLLDGGTAVIAMVSMGHPNSSVALLIPSQIFEAALSTHVMRPEVSIEEVLENQHIIGSFQGLDRSTIGHFKIVVYVRTPGFDGVPSVGWYKHPYNEGGEGKSWAKIEPTGCWKIETVNRKILNIFSSDQIAAFLVWSDYNSPEYMPNFDHITYIANKRIDLRQTPWYGKV